MQQYPKTSLTTQTSNEISIYKGQLTKQGYTKAVAMLEAAFPKMDKAFHNILKERFKANNFSDERMLDSIGHVIDTYEGWDKIPNVANFINFDVKATLYTYEQVCEQNLWDYVTAVDIGIGKPKWVKTEFSKYFSKWENKNV